MITRKHTFLITMRISYFYEFLIPHVNYKCCKNLMFSSRKELWVLNLTNSCSTFSWIVISLYHILLIHILQFIFVSLQCWSTDKILWPKQSHVFRHFSFRRPQVYYCYTIKLYAWRGSYKVINTNNNNKNN